MRRRMVPAIALLVFALYALSFEGAGLDYWDTYIVAPAAMIAGRPATFVDADGHERFPTTAAGRLPHDLVNPATFGILSKDQRIGAGVTFAPAYLVLGMLGFRVLYALLGALAFAFSYLVGRRLFAGTALPAALGLLVAVNPYLLLMNRLNANFVFIPFMAGVLALLLEERPQWLVAGLAFGALGGIKNEAIVLVPALAVLIGLARRAPVRLLTFGAGSVLGILPYLAWNRFAFGRAFIHASQYGAFDGFRPTFPHRFLFWEFDLNGLFNWPFHEALVRTPHYPFPTYLTLPLTLLLCFGLVLSALALLGAAVQWRKSRSFAVFLYLWIALGLGLFLFQENWEEPKNTFGAMVVPPLAILAARGIEWIARAPRAGRRWVSLGATVLLLRLLVFAASQVEVPVDERWYLRFPKARVEATSIGCLEDRARREWMFFHTDECPAELAEQRAKLTRGGLLPRLYYPLVLRVPPVDDEWGHYAPRLFDVWDRIYGY